MNARFAKIADKIARSARIAALLCAEVEHKWESPKAERKTWRRELPDGTYEYRDTPPEKQDKKPEEQKPKPIHPVYKNVVTLKRPQLEKTLSKGHYTIMSGARNPNDPKEAKMEPTDEFFHKRHEELRNELEKADVKYTECVGHYEGKEPSFMVFHDPQELTAKTVKSVMVHHKDRDELKSRRKFLEGLGKKFNQDSVLHGSNGTNRMVFTTGKLKGKVCGGKGWKEVPEAEDYYTDVNLKKNAHTKFTLDIKSCFDKGYIPQGETKTEKSFFDEKELALPEETHQKAKDEKTIYSDAKEAQEDMMTWLNKGKGIDKKLGLTHYDLAKEGTKIDFDKQGPILVTAPMKTEKRAKEKVETECGGDWSELMDVVRATIAVDKPSEINNVMSALRKSGMKLARKPSDRFRQPVAGGYRDLKMNVEYQNGHIGELQIHMKSLLKAKSDLGGHKLYKQARSIKDEATKEGRNTLTPEEHKIVDELEAKMKELYSAAWEQSQQEKKASMKTAAETRYFEYNGNPAEWAKPDFPVIFVKGKETVFRDIWRFLHDAVEVDKAKFDKMRGNRKSSERAIAERVASAFFQ